MPVVRYTRKGPSLQLKLPAGASVRYGNVILRGLGESVVAAEALDEIRRSNPDVEFVDETESSGEGQE